MHRCVGGDGRADPQRTLGVLRELDADVIALQELEWRAEDALHLLEEFARGFGYAALAGPTLLRADGHYGNALLTRLEVQGCERIDLSVPHREPRGALDATLGTRGATLRVIATHLGLAPAERRAQVERLLARIDGAPAPIALMGDLNEWLLWGRPLRWLRRHFGSAPAPATFPARRPLFALDRIWVEPRASLTAVAVHASPAARAASDHLPLRAVIEVPGKATD